MYEYYQKSDLSLEEIIDHYVQTFFLKVNGRNRVDEIIRRVKDSSKLHTIDSESIKLRVVPNHIDFGSAINEMFWFLFKSNSTHALAVLIAANEWNKRVNDVYHFGLERDVREKAIRIFKKYDMYEEMTQDEFNRHATATIADDNIKKSPSNSALENKKVTKRWKLLEFCKQYGVPEYIDDFVDVSGKPFPAMSFKADKFEPSEVASYVDSNNKMRKLSFIMVTFDKELAGVVSFDYIIEHKYELQIVRIVSTESPYPLYELKPTDELQKKLNEKPQKASQIAENVESNLPF